MTTKPAKKWSKKVSDHSDALDLQQGVFAQPDPKKIAASLKDSAEHSERRKSNPFRSAMSMLTFYINRAGAKLSGAQRKRLDQAKGELRKQFDRPDSAGAAGTATPATKATPRIAKPKAAAKRSRKKAPRR